MFCWNARPSPSLRRSSCHGLNAARFRGSYAPRPSPRSSTWRARRSDARTHAGRSETCSRFWTSLRSIVPYWRAPLKARSATSRMPLSSSPRGRCRPRSFSLVTREILRGPRFPFTPRARCRPSLIRPSRVERMPEAQSSSWRRCRSRFGVGERADTQAGSPSIRAGTMCPKAQQSPLVSGAA